ncbi:unnamed protein product [Timema podura]|uniref:Uncharacterized protein n=1 Tax=Timema podura TaxID=61482 RepID=A0ABN7P5A1_TIMPD|nr:unnamed protein product [Timema podura]
MSTANQVSPLVAVTLQQPELCGYRTFQLVVVVKLFHC